MKKPIAVLISDIHFNLQNLELASISLKTAFEKALVMGVPLVVAGDLHDSKANLRGECVKAMLDIFAYYSNVVESYVIVGNHCLINEKSNENSIEFLSYYTHLVKQPVFVPKLNASLIPYMSNKEDFIKAVQASPSPRIIAHQGVQGALMGDYVVDKSAVEPAALTGFKIISGHYHKHQTVGPVTYIGSPYTMSFGEANDGPKGFLILYEDFSFKQIPLNLRKHIIVERTSKDVFELIKDLNNSLNSNDKVWIKLSGTQAELDKISKHEIAQQVMGHENFRLDKICTDVKASKPNIEKLSDDVILDKVIDDSNRSDEDKQHLKVLWREILE